MGKLTMSSSLLSFVLLCIVFVHSATAQALDSKDKGYGMDAPTYDGYKTKDYKDSKDSEYEMRSILNGYKNDGDDKNGKDLYEKEYRTDPYARTYRTDPYARTYRNDPYAREYRAP